VLAAVGAAAHLLAAFGQLVADTRAAAPLGGVGIDLKAEERCVQLASAARAERLRAC
jgi:hypothetical protein